MLSQLNVLSPTTRCRTFSADADGYARGEGCGMVVLKRLSDAQRDGDPILAVVRGSAVNDDGRSAGLTVPNGTVQRDVLRQALNVAGLAPNEVDYVECHGTGTKLGDPIEVRALGDVYSEGRDAAHPLVIGAVKTNIGHLEAAAGVAGFIKTVLSLQQAHVPPHLHAQQVNPEVPLQEYPLAIAHQGRAWPQQERPRVAGLSAFGITGTNAHLVLEQAPDAPQAVDTEGPAVLLVSARSPAALAQAADALTAHLKTTPSLANVAHTLAVGRAPFTYRLALVANTAEDARTALGAFVNGEPADLAIGAPEQVAAVGVGLGGVFCWHFESPFVCLGNPTTSSLDSQGE